jgi:hypothetical protein
MYFRYKVRDKNKFRSGEITADRVAAYSGYKANLKALALAVGGTAVVTTTAAATYTAVLPGACAGADHHPSSSLVKGSNNDNGSTSTSTSTSSTSSTSNNSADLDRRSAGAKGLAGCALLELEERSGFGFAMREGVAWVTTPFVIVVQHDRAFTHAAFQRFESSSKHYKAQGSSRSTATTAAAADSDLPASPDSSPLLVATTAMPDGSLFDLVATVTAMRAHRSWLHYVGLATSRTVKHAQLVLSKYQVRVQTVTADVREVAGDGAGAGAATSVESAMSSIQCSDGAHQAALLALEAKGCAAWDAGGDGGERDCSDKVGPEDAPSAAAAPHASHEDAFEVIEAEGGEEDNDDVPARIRLVPLVQWYDTTHVASTWYYRRFVFDRRARRVAKGGFIEDKVCTFELY